MSGAHRYHENLTRLTIADIMIRDDLHREPVEALEDLLSRSLHDRELEHVDLVAAKMLEQYPTHRAALTALLETRIAQSQPKKAESRLLRAAQREPDSVGIRELLVILYQHIGEHEKAARVQRNVAALRRRAAAPPTLLEFSELAALNPADSCPSLVLDQVVSDPLSCPSLVVSPADVAPDTCGTIVLSHEIHVAPVPPGPGAPPPDPRTAERDRSGQPAIARRPDRFAARLRLRRPLRSLIVHRIE
jgi:hypothetical protein